MNFKSAPYKKVIFKGDIVKFDSEGEMSTTDKDLVWLLSNLADVKEVKSTKTAEK